ncbi:MAG: hypothetical protein KTR32_17600 [Granulosicoccus sp.]|nr:hypothetical protein [Granulosicoccus sp.]
MAVIRKQTSILDLAGIVSTALERANITAVLSGGAAVSIYTDNRYKSLDLDFVSTADTRVIEAALAPLGFKRQDNSRYFIHDKTDYVLEFPSGPLAVGHQLVVEWSQLETSAGVVQVLTPTQMIMDRLAAYFHWNDPQSLDQAVWIANDHSIDLENLKDWAEGEDNPEKFATFLRRANL